jgi:hypothetical protein
VLVGQLFKKFGLFLNTGEFIFLCGSQYTEQLLTFTELTDWFLGMFAKFCKVTASFVVFVSVRPSAWKSLAPIEWNFMKFGS